MNIFLFRFFAIAVIACTCISPQPESSVFAASSLVPYYIFPIPNSTRLNPQTSIIVRYQGLVNSDRISAESFQVSGEKSGTHTGRMALADDQVTVIFTPTHSFALGEKVQVTIKPDWIDPQSGPFVFSFLIDPNLPNDSVTSAATSFGLANKPLLSNQTGVSASSTKAGLFSSYLTLPPNYPSYTYNLLAGSENLGDYFLAPFTLNDTSKDFILIADNSGEPVYIQNTPNQSFDFKKQPNGLLSYFDGSILGFRILNSSYQEIRTIYAKNGYTADLHDLQLLPSNHCVFIIYDSKIVDMRPYGGLEQATVMGVVIQELDGAGNVVFEWRSWDHFLFTDADSNVSLIANFIDYVHTNAVQLDWDGNYLISSRHLDEITKIDRRTGDIRWRLGGENNQFTFTNVDISGTLPFAFQHDIRRLPNGNITLFDNRNYLSPPYSRAVEYQIDEDLKTITQIWESRSYTPDVFSMAMGNAQRLVNGNTVIGWGWNSNFPSGKQPDITEVKSDGTKVFELTFDLDTVSYRAFRFDWHGSPTWPPIVAYKSDPGQITVGTSWNGATEVDHYELFSGSQFTDPPQLVSAKPKTGFETQWTISADISSYCFFLSKAYDNSNNLLGTSLKIYNPSCLPYHYSLPVISN